MAFLWVCYVLNHADRQVVYTLFPALQQEFGYQRRCAGSHRRSLSVGIRVCARRCRESSAIAGRRPSCCRQPCALELLHRASGLAPNGSLLLVCRALLGISESLFMPAAYALMANAHGPATRSKAVAIFATSQMVGVAVGGSLSGFIAERLHWRASFWILGCAGLLFAFPLTRFFRRLPSRI